MKGILRFGPFAQIVKKKLELLMKKSCKLVLLGEKQAPQMGSKLLSKSAVCGK
jgi:hypothetical protein